MYQQTGEQAGADQAADAGGSDAPGQEEKDNVVDADYEVKEDKENK